MLNECNTTGKWEYRIIHRNTPDFSSGFYEITEVWYNRKGYPCFFSTEAIISKGRTIEELKEHYAKVSTAFSKPVFYPEFEIKNYKSRDYRVGDF